MKELLVDKKKGINRKPGSDRPSKNKNLVRPDWSKFNNEELRVLAERYFDLMNRPDVQKIIKNIEKENK